MNTTRDNMISITIHLGERPTLPLNKDTKPSLVSIEGDHENRPVYLVLMPILDHCLDTLQADNGEDVHDPDAFELSVALSMVRDFIDSRDTTVRETY